MPRSNNLAAALPLVVLIEDDVALGRALQFTLQIDGYTVVLLHSAETFLARPFPPMPVCIVTDLQLPGVSGVEALEILRQRDIGAPALLMTTNPTPALTARAAAVGAAVLEKPIFGDRLRDAIRGLEVG